MNECGTCDRYFNDWHAAKQHMDALHHIWECPTCDDGYYYEDHLEEHQAEEDHYGPIYECEACTAGFDTIGGAKKHMNSMQHWRNNWCKDCNRGFESENNLRAVREPNLYFA
jgi:DNA-directed RNA polymerase subunit RPC12/RpoP